MKKITKADVRKVLKDFEIYKHEVFTLDDSDENFKMHYKEFYVWYNMLISFVKNKRNKRLYVKFEGDIPIALIEYIEKRYPNNEILSLYPKNNEYIKNCYTVLINRIKDLYIFLKESRNYWIQMENIEEEFLYLEEQEQRKKLIP